MVVSKILKGIVVLSSAYAIAMPTSFAADGGAGKELVPARQGKFAKMAQNLRAGEGERAKIIAQTDEELAGFFKSLVQYDEINKNLDVIVPQADQRRNEVISRSLDVIHNANRVMGLLVSIGKHAENTSLQVVFSADEAKAFADALEKFTNSSEDIYDDLLELAQEMKRADKQISIERSKLEQVKAALEKAVKDAM